MFHPNLTTLVSILYCSSMTEAQQYAWQPKGRPCSGAWCCDSMLPYGSSDRLKLDPTTQIVPAGVASIKRGSQPSMAELLRDPTAGAQGHCASAAWHCNSARCLQEMRRVHQYGYTSTRCRCDVRSQQDNGVLTSQSTRRPVRALHPAQPHRHAEHVAGPSVQPPVVPPAVHAKQLRGVVCQCDDHAYESAASQQSIETQEHISIQPVPRDAGSDLPQQQQQKQFSNRSSDTRMKQQHSAVGLNDCSTPRSGRAGKAAPRGRVRRASSAHRTGKVGQGVTGAKAGRSGQRRHSLQGQRTVQRQTAQSSAKAGLGRTQHVTRSTRRAQQQPEVQANLAYGSPAEVMWHRDPSDADHIPVLHDTRARADTTVARLTNRYPFHTYGSRYVHGEWGDCEPSADHARVSN